MADIFCFSCGKKFGRFSLQYNMKAIEKIGEVPFGMTKEDQVCSSCFSLVQQGLSLEYEQKSRQRQREEESNLENRIDNYTDTLNKYGVLVFKNERIAIAHKTTGNIGSFMIIFDDLTKEGYNLKAIENITE